MIRVLVVDDSAVARHLLTEVLGRHHGIDVVTVSTGQAALDRLDAVAPDIVTLDVEMPGLGGLDVLRQLKARRPRLPVVMVSAQTARGAAVTIDALLLGADDYVTKPSRAASREAGLSALAGDLIPKVVALHAARQGTGRPETPVRRTTPRRVGTPTNLGVVVIGSSTGGPDALAHLCTALPSRTIVPIVVVQHMPAMFTRLLAERLDRGCAVDVAEAVDGEPLAPGRVLVAPGDRHLRLRRGDGAVVARLESGPPVHSCRPAVDLTVADAAEVYGAATLAVILTGMGRDGAAGASAVVATGGRVLVQDAATSVVWGMPGAVVNSGCADAVLPLDALCAEVADAVSAGPSALSWSRSASLSGARP
jgi:two-component system chemotaxis response regulator CheB